MPSRTMVWSSATSTRITSFSILLISEPRSFASKPAPTVSWGGVQLSVQQHKSLLERACSRKRQPKHHKTIRPQPPAHAHSVSCPPPAHFQATTARPLSTPAHAYPPRQRMSADL